MFVGDIFDAVASISSVRQHPHDISRRMSHCADIPFNGVGPACGLDIKKLCFACRIPQKNESHTALAPAKAETAVEH